MSNQNQSALLNRALEYEMKAMEIAEKDRSENYPFLRHFINIYIQFADIFICQLNNRISFDSGDNQIVFYDENFRDIRETISIHQNEVSLIEACERCLTEAIVRCRKINYNSEPEILLLFAKLKWIKINFSYDYKIDTYNNMLADLVAAIEIAEKSSYYFVLSRIHLFCAEMLLEIRKRKLYKLDKIFDGDFRFHIYKCKEYAIDNSTINDVFLPKEFDNFYKDFPEYDMLKRGMTEKERIENGYYVIWHQACLLEQQN